MVVKLYSWRQCLVGAFCFAYSYVLRLQQVSVLIVFMASMLGDSMVCIINLYHGSNGLTRQVKFGLIFANS